MRCGGSTSPACSPWAKYGAGPSSGRTRGVERVVRVLLERLFAVDLDDALSDVTRGWPSLKRIHFAFGDSSARVRNVGELRSQLNLSVQTRAQSIQA